MEIVETNMNYAASEEPISDVIDEDDLMKLFHQFSGLTLPISD